MRFWLSTSILLCAACCGSAADSGKNGDDTGSPAACANEENGACVLEGAYTEDLTLTADRPWLLRSKVAIGDDSSEVTLTIEPGTKIYGESATGGFLVITRGADIVAEGTADAPIVFTSDQPEGSRARGDWGGVAINGYGVINACTDGTTPCEAEGEGGTGKYGGDDNGDSSGVLEYVVVEFGGTEISPDNEINGLGLQGVGSGTEIDHVQIHRNLDDGIEFWGGAVEVRHLLVTAPGDDGIDWDLGWQGKIQYAVVHQADDAGNHGLETDNNEESHTAAPVSSPTIANLTILGSRAIAEDNFGFVLRRGSQPDVYNMAIDAFSVGCLAIRDQATFDAFAAGDASLEGVALACDAPFEVSEEETEVGTEEEVFEASGTNALVDDLMLTNPDAGDYRPAAGSPLLGAGQSKSDAFFEATDFIGAFDAGTDWTSGWTTRAVN
ncbi:MAG: hypothetical protein ACOZNI_18225 [Myxococcota bacterium]